MFTPPDTWKRTGSIASPELHSPPAAPSWDYKPLLLSSAIAMILVVLVKLAYQYFAKKPKPRSQKSKSTGNFTPMQAVVIPTTPIHPRSHEFPPSPAISTSSSVFSTSSVESTPSFSSTSSQPQPPFRAVPHDFPRGPDLTLTNRQIRQAFFFSPKDRRIIDPNAIYWTRRHGATLRTEFWGSLLRRTNPVEQMSDETPFGVPEWVLRSNLGSDWADLVRYYEKPYLYDSKGNLRTSPMSGHSRR